MKLFNYTVLIEIAFGEYKAVMRHKNKPVARDAYA